MLISVTACNRKATKDIKQQESKLTVYEQIVTEMCDCFSDLFPLMEKQKELTEAGDTEGLTQLMEKVMPILEETGKCAETLEEKYSHIDMEDEANIAKLDEAAKTHCPEIANL